MNPSRSEFLRVRGLRYHVRRWGPSDAPMLFATHGWLDVSATFDPVMRHVAPRLQVLMPDWRGFGYTEWPQDGYWFHDYVADLEAIVDHYAPGDVPILLAGHSMGAQAVSMFAGARPARVAKLAILDGLFLPDQPVETTPKRFVRWLDGVKARAEVPSYRSFDELASRVQKRHPHLPPERCAFIARCWGHLDADGMVRLMSDPKHLLDMPRPYRQDEVDTIWARVTAETLFVDGGASPFLKNMPTTETARRRALFRNHSATVIEGARHMLHFDAPEALAERLLEFFAR